MTTDIDSQAPILAKQSDSQSLPESSQTIMKYVENDQLAD